MLASDGAQALNRSLVLLDVGLVDERHECPVFPHLCVGLHCYHQSFRLVVHIHNITHPVTCCQVVVKIDQSHGLCYAVDMFPIYTLSDVVKVWIDGSRKHGTDDWIGRDKSLLDKATRHLAAHNESPIDQDSGMPHIIRAAANLLLLAASSGLSKEAGSQATMVGLLSCLGVPQSRIAACLGISRQRVHALYKKTLPIEEQQSQVLGDDT